MAKRGYKLQEFVAHSANVNCIKIGKKTRRHFITGGDDEIVNLWSIGKPTPITSLSGHTSPIESVAFNSAEVLVAAGASSGAVKLWDLQETKVVRTLNGHRSYCTAVEFHPFGEFFASGSMDTNLKIWDIRKKGCIHTYKSHKRAISTIKFTPDGRWVVSGGLDNVVKIWDLTAGKLLHEFNYHEGHIKSMDFHPLEFLLATGSSDKTVKFWDLETFELIGSTRPEETGVRSIMFHPDGRTLFCGLDDSLKVYSWEPVICHDGVDLGWSTLGDLCINDEKLLGCSYYQNSIGVWAADISQIEPYKHNMSAKGSVMERVETPRRSFIPQDDDTKDIKNIYVDTAGVSPVASKKDGVSSKPPHRRRPSSTKLDIEELSASVESVLKSGSSTATNNNNNIQRRLFADDVDKNSSEEKTTTSTCVAKEFHKSSSPSKLRKENRDVSVDLNKGLKPVKNGVAVVNGRTRSLVEKYEKREKLDAEECKKPDLATQLSANTDNVSTTTIEEETINGISSAIPDGATSATAIRVPDMSPCAESVAKNSQISLKTPDLLPSPVSEVKSSQMLVKTPKASPMQRPVASRRVISGKVRSSPMLVTRRSRASTHVIPGRNKTSPLSGVPRHEIFTHMKTEKTISSPLLEEDNPQTTGRGDDDLTQEFMLDHDPFLTTLRSRHTKLQVVRHFWERNDMRGAINALHNLPDHAVHADVISVMLENMDSLTLDIFSCLLPLLLGLFDSQTERHINVSLEMLLKLVAVFGPVINSTISAPPAVGIDLHAEKRFESCNECHVHLQKIHKTLPIVIRRGGLPARSAQELNLILQQ